MPQILQSQFKLEHFWEKLSGAPRALLMLDFDGTLSPLVAQRGEAKLYPGVRELLLALIRQDEEQLRIVSGRDIDDLRKRLGLESPPELWGCHGWQRQRRNGECTHQAMSKRAIRAFELAANVADNAGCSEQIERKSFSLAVHWRGVADSERRRLQKEVVGPWRKLCRDDGLVLVPFDGGAELRCPGITKGSVVRLLMEEAKGAEMAYLGDDLTDEDAFAALGSEGLKVLVRPRLRDTRADLWLQPPDELLWFLEQWLQARGEGG